MESNVNVKKIFIFLLFLSLQLLEFSLASEDHVSDKFGEGKALKKVSDSRGFVLSSEAINTIGIETKVISKNEKIPDSSIVSIRNKKGIYVLRDSFFKFIEFNSNMKLQQREHIVVKGQNLLLITDIYSTDETEYSH